jgi:hypothetical protein
METLTWYFELIDKMSGPAKTIAHAVGSVSSALKQAKGSSAGFGSAIGAHMKSARAAVMSVGRSASAVGGAFRDSIDTLKDWGSPLVSIATTGIAAVSAIGAVAAAFGSAALEALAFKDEALASLNVLTGSERQGQVAFLGSQMVGRQTSYDTRGVIRARQQIAGAGFDNRAADSIFSLAADLGALSGEGAAGMQRAVLALGQINNAGRGTTLDVRQLQNVGLNMSRFYEAAAKRLGIGGSGAALNRRMAAMLSHGQIDSTTTIAAAMDAVQAQTGLRLGGLAQKQGESLTGQISNIKSAFEDFIMSMDLNSPGLQGLKNFLKSISDTLTPGSAAGQRLMSILNSGASMLGGLLSGITKDDVAGFVDKILAAVRALVPHVMNWFRIFRAFFGGFARGAIVVGLALAVALGKIGENETMLDIFEKAGVLLGVLMAIIGGAIVIVTGVVVTIIGGLQELALWFATFASEAGTAWGEVWDSIRSLWNDVVAPWFVGLATEAYAWGVNIIEGLINGIKSAPGAIRDAVVGVGQGIKDTFTGLFDMHSPSRVMMRMGGYVSEGFAIGIAGGAGAAQDEINGLFDMPSPSAIRAGVRGASRGTSLAGAQITVQVDARGASDPDAVANAVAAQLPSALAEALLQLEGAELS